jgi:hypothetical protein
VAGADRGNAGSKGGGVMLPHPVGLPRFLRPPFEQPDGADTRELEEGFFGEDPSDEPVDDENVGPEQPRGEKGCCLLMSQG